MKCIVVVCLIFVLIDGGYTMRRCRPARTTVSGTKAPRGSLCRGQLLLNEQFNTFDRNLWHHEVTLGGGGNGEFQWYTDDGRNSYVKDSKLWLSPTFTSDEIGEDGLESATIDLGAQCTNDMWNGCKRTGTPESIINPIRSARVRTLGSFSFKYGRLEVVAKMPTGDWLWPAIWLLPSTNDVYGIWPRSGEMDLVESRKFNDALTHICCPKYGDDSVICSHFIPIKMIDLGGNRDYVNHVGQQIGVEHIGSTLHFGTNWDDNGYTTATFSKNSKPGYNMGFHRYEMVWTPEYIRFCVDGRKVGVVEVGDGFYSRYPFHGPNPWVNGTKAAPFDQQVNLSAFVYNGPTICPVSNRFNEIRTDLFESQFHILINLAIGGTNGFFPDNEEKPWSNSMHNAMTAFWRGRSQWTPTWNFNSTDAQASSLAVESVRVWAI